MTQATDSPWLHRFAAFTAVATLLLIAIGGLVTSHGAGMAVPDWPNSYGYNMFAFPVSQWVGGVLYEHTHRLWASVVGFCTLVLTLWLFGVKARPWLRWGASVVFALGVLSAFSPRVKIDNVLFLCGTGAVGFAVSFLWPRCLPGERRIRKVALIALFAVVAQGILGGVRVVALKDEIGIFHAALAQVFLVLVALIAVWTSPAWNRVAANAHLRFPTFVRTLFLIATTLIFIQLVLGATMRHQHAGLAVPDFPLAYGRIWPRMDDDFVHEINSRRIDVRDFNAITSAQIALHMSHRIMALAILSAVALIAWKTRQSIGAKSWPARASAVWLALIAIQALLGAATVWSNKAADMATAHVVVGAASLVLGALVTIAGFQAAPARSSVENHQPARPLEPRRTAPTAALT